MTRQIHATITVEGDDAQLRAYRARVNELLDADRDVPYRELHTAGRLDYRSKGRGVPYPAFVTASSDFPELTIQVKWENTANGQSGRATIQAGRLTEQSFDEGSNVPELGCELRVDRDGLLVFALACRRRGADWIGYALTATQHAFFRLNRAAAGIDVLDASDGVVPEWAERWTITGKAAEYAALDPCEGIDAPLFDDLDRIAHAFVDEWIWFAESPAEETAVERQRYEIYGFKVNPANVRAAKLKTVMRAAPDGGFIHEIADAGGREVAAVLARHWLQQARH